MIDPERLRAMVRLLGPEEMTPTAKRMLLSLADEADSQPDEPSSIWHAGLPCEIDQVTGLCLTPKDDEEDDQ